MARHNRKRKLSKKEQKALSKESTQRVEVAATPKARPIVRVELPETITVAELAKRTGRTPAEIVGSLLANGVIATVNDSVDRDTIAIIAPELDLDVHQETAVATARAVEDKFELASRPPVVVVLGHVDHGKTTLLDTIRKANVVAGESGGITQHIGAYQVLWHTDDGGQRPITFIDTPGHEAFSAMRAHGVTMTDVAILVVAADDGVKPQTKEAISHAKAANVPIIVAINKMDKPGAAIDRVKGELAELGLAAEEWGGKTPTVPVSAKEGTGIDELLDTVLLVADLAELQARPTGPAEGVVIEAHMAQGIGPVATVLVQHGQLAVGDPIAIGTVSGKVRVMEDAAGIRHRSVGPATPVRVAGLDGVPTFGAILTVAGSDREAKALAQAASLRTAKTPVARQSEDEESATPTLSVVLKADVDGSLKAIQHTLEALEVEGVQIRVVHQGVGDLSESDINFALSSAHPFVVAFRAGATVAARMLARSKQIQIHAYDIIYRLSEDVLTAAQALREPEYVTEEIGRLKVLQIFRTTKTAQIIGGRVEQGKIAKGAMIDIHREGESVGTGTIETLQRGQTKADEVAEGEECGLGVSTTETIVEGDVLVASIKVAH